MVTTYFTKVSGESRSEIFTKIGAESPQAHDITGESVGENVFAKLANFTSRFAADWRRFDQLFSPKIDKRYQGDVSSLVALVKIENPCFHQPPGSLVKIARPFRGAFHPPGPLAGTWGLQAAVAEVRQ